MKTYPMGLFMRRISRMLAVLLIGSTAIAMTNEETAAALKLSKFVLSDYPEILRLEGIPDCETLVAMSRDAEGRPRDVLALETTKPEFAAALEADHDEDLRAAGCVQGVRWWSMRR
jgi:hypothetical protein